MAITPLPSAPLVTDDTATFNTKAFAWVDAIDTFTTEANALATQVNSDATTAAQAADAADAAIGAANYKGEWSTLTGSLNIPASVSHNGEVWLLTQNLGDVTANEPGVGSPAVWLSLSPAAAGTYQAIASGSLSDGSPVIVNADGTVSVVEGSTPSQFAGNNGGASAAYDSTNNKIVIAYQDNTNSDYGTAVVGTVSGTSISFGAPVVFHSAGISASSAITFDSTSNQVVIAYRDAANSSRGTAIVGAVSGTSISFGSAAVFETGSIGADFGITYDSSNNRIVVAYQDVSNSNYGTAAVGTVSGTSISFGTPVVFESAVTGYVSATYDSSNNKIIISYKDTGNSGNGTAIVGTVSGTSISFGTPVVFESSGQTDFIRSTFDSTNNKVVVVYRASSLTNDPGRAIVGTVSGTSISFGTPVTFSNDGTNTFSMKASHNPSTNKIVVCFGDNGTVLGNANSTYSVIGEVSGTSISFGDKNLVLSATSGSSTETRSVIYDSSSQQNIVIIDDNGTNTGQAVVLFDNGAVTTLTSENYIGISSGAYTNGQTATVQVVGAVDDAQTGLTPGQAYYVQITGGLSTTPARPSVLAGIAVSSTKLLIK